jgi:integrase
MPVWRMKDHMSYTRRQQNNYASCQGSRNLYWPEDPDQNDFEDSTRLGSVPNPLKEKLPKLAGFQDVLPRGCEELKVESSGITIREFVERFFVPEHVAMKTRSGRIHYQAMLKHVIKPAEVDCIFQIGAEAPKSKLKEVPDWPYLGNTLLSETRPENVQRIVSAALIHGYSAQTATHIRSTIFSVFEYAIKGRWITGPNPAKWAARPEMIRKETQALTLTQTKQVLEVMQCPEKEMALIALTTGMNIAEICGLQWKFVNLTSDSCDSGGQPIPPRTIAVRKQWYRGYGLMNGRKGRARELPIPDPLLPVLLGLRNRAAFTGPDDFVLVSRDGRPINDRTIAVSRLGPIGDQFEIPGLSWHVFGRTRMNLLYEFGIKFQELIISPPVKPPHNVTVPNAAAWARALRTQVVPGLRPQFGSV